VAKHPPDQSTTAAKHPPEENSNQRRRRQSIRQSSTAAKQPPTDDQRDLDDVEELNKGRHRSGSSREGQSTATGKSIQDNASSEGVTQMAPSSSDQHGLGFT